MKTKSKLTFAVYFLSDVGLKFQSASNCDDRHNSTRFFINGV